MYKSIIHGDAISLEELNAMSKDELKALAKANYIKLYTTVPEKMASAIFEVWNNRLHKGDAFRA